jgi:hypothetical protein
MQRCSLLPPLHGQVLRAVTRIRPYSLAATSKFSHAVQLTWLVPNGARADGRIFSSAFLSPLPALAPLDSELHNLTARAVTSVTTTVNGAGPSWTVLCPFQPWHDSPPSLSFPSSWILPRSFLSFHRHRLQTLERSLQEFGPPSTRYLQGFLTEDGANDSRDHLPSCSEFDRATHLLSRRDSTRWGGVVVLAALSAFCKDTKPPPLDLSISEMISSFTTRVSCSFSK